MWSPPSWNETCIIWKTFIHHAEPERHTIFQLVSETNVTNSHVTFSPFLFPSFLWFFFSFFPCLTPSWIPSFTSSFLYSFLSSFQMSEFPIFPVILHFHSLCLETFFFFFYMMANKSYWRHSRVGLFFLPYKFALVQLKWMLLNPFRRAVSTALESLPFAARTRGHEVERQHAANQDLIPTVSGWDPILDWWRRMRI